MASKGTIAKQNVINRIASAFGDNFIGEIDKKVYVWADDGGQKVQIAISLTCPKVAVEAPAGSRPVEVSGGFDWSDGASADKATPTATPKAEITQEELDEVSAMMKRLGL